MIPLVGAERKPIFRTAGGFWASAIRTEVSVAAAMTSMTIFLLMGFLFLTSRLMGCVLLNHLIRSRQHVRRNRLTILDFRFWILRLRSAQVLDCSIIGLLCRP